MRISACPERSWARQLTHRRQPHGRHRGAGGPLPDLAPGSPLLRAPPPSPSALRGRAARAMIPWGGASARGRTHMLGGRDSRHCQPHRSGPGSTSKAGTARPPPCRRCQALLHACGSMLAACCRKRAASRFPLLAAHPLPARSAAPFATAAARRLPGRRCFGLGLPPLHLLLHIVHSLVDAMRHPVHLWAKRLLFKVSVWASKTMGAGHVRTPEVAASVQTRLCSGAPPRLPAHSMQDGIKGAGALRQRLSLDCEPKE